MEAEPKCASPSDTRFVSMPDRRNRRNVGSLERAGVLPAFIVPVTIEGGLTNPVRRAAQYVRMSTDHQQFSIPFQLDAIRAYAKSRDMTIVRTYADEAKSGLTLTGRAALRQLLADVVGGQADFDTILVYDVSRWGRFQDVDESAYYEFLCRREGIHIEYCMEPFRNDGTAISSLLKTVKRVMAGEYSRELGEKVAAGKHKAARRGHWPGAPAGYGYRRVLLDSKGRVLRALDHGETKLVSTDRVSLVPGPKSEVETVRWIFREVADRSRRPGELAKELNERGTPWLKGKNWDSGRVQYMLSNEKYIGTMVYRRTTVRLHRRSVRNPVSTWIRTEGCHEAIVDPALFWRAQETMDGWSSRISNEKALDKLRALLKREGRLSAELIDAARDLPSVNFYRSRFGGLSRVYELVGYTPSRDYSFLKGQAARNRMLRSLRARAAERLEKQGVRVESASPSIMRLNGRVLLGFAFGHPKRMKIGQRWLVQVSTLVVCPDWLIAARLNADRSAIIDYGLIKSGVKAVWLKAKHRTISPDEHYDREFEPIVDRLARVLVSKRARSTNGTRKPRA